MELGNFCLSLTVKDLKVSLDFYGKLGFEVVGGELSQNWLVLRNGTTKLGLFQGMFDRNMLTFNPGWNGQAEKLDAFEDVRELKAKLEASGVELQAHIETDSGPGYLSLTDPDGNPILIDQHV